MTPPSVTASVPIEKLKRSLRSEAAEEPSSVSTAPATKATQVIAIYGKGGIGRSEELV
jgi:chlorophyllide a reductase subunit X